MNRERGHSVAADDRRPAPAAVPQPPDQPVLASQRHHAARHSRPRLTPGSVLRRRLSRPRRRRRAPARHGGVRRSGVGQDRARRVVDRDRDRPGGVADGWPRGQRPDPVLDPVLAALRDSGSIAAGSALATLDPSTGVTDAVLVTIMDGLDELTAPVVLVLDDFHELRRRPVLDDLDDLLLYPPAGFRIVLLTRAEPTLRLHRLRVAGDIAEIRAPDLAFREDEAALLFANRELRVTGADLAAVLERTEGWAAGLQLAAASPRDRSAGSTGRRPRRRPRASPTI